MSNNLHTNDEAQLDQLLAQLADQTGQVQANKPMSKSDALLKARIMAALPATSMTTKPAAPDTQLDTWLENAWQWFTQPLRLAAAAALPLLVGFVLGNATLITDSELLLALSEQDSWPVEQMLDDTQWSGADE